MIPKIIGIPYGIKWEKKRNYSKIFTYNKFKQMFQQIKILN
jgi:hypothetical protein